MEILGYSHFFVILDFITPHSFLWSPAAPASALYSATAARQGGSVAASLVDSCEFRTTVNIEIIPACFLSAHLPPALVSACGCICTEWKLWKWVQAGAFVVTCGCMDMRRSLCAKCMLCWLAASGC